jgi:hypothetical protein
VKRPFDRCSVEGCDNPYDSHGLCKAHAYRLKRYGDPDGRPMPRRARSPSEMLAAGLTRGGPHECWPWRGSVNPVSGYGQVSWREVGGRKGTVAHRLAWILERGPIPPSYTIDHRCENRLCCNPGHMLLATRAENGRRGAAKRWGTIGDVYVCRHGHVGERAVSASGGPYCRACNREAQRARRARVPS